MKIHGTFLRPDGSKRPKAERVEIHVPSLQKQNTVRYSPLQSLADLCVEPQARLPVAFRGLGRSNQNEICEIAK